MIEVCNQLLLVGACMMPVVYVVMYVQLLLDG